MPDALWKIQFHKPCLPERSSVPQMQTEGTVKRKKMCANGNVA